ncbi:MAG: DHHW family protein [Myxococcota bacterium]|nr:DHHW family protein [Myxococcota bacterium]
MNHRSHVYAFVFPLFVTVVGIVSLTGEADPMIQSTERRAPTQLPSLDWTSWTKVTFAPALEKWFEDRFFARQASLTVQTEVNALKGFTQDGDRIVDVDIDALLDGLGSEDTPDESSGFALPAVVEGQKGEADPMAKADETMARHPATQSTNQTSTVELNPSTHRTPDWQNRSARAGKVNQTHENSANTKATNTKSRAPSFGSKVKGAGTKAPPRTRFVKGLLIKGNRAIQLFGGSKLAAKGYADILSEIGQKLPDTVKMYALVAPTSISFRAPKKYDRYRMQERNFIKTVGESLAPSVIHIDPYPLMDENQDQYLFFRTDHHWTARGAYWAYVAFTKLAGVPAVELDSMTAPEPKTFYGSLFGVTRAKELLRGKDRLEIWIPKVDYTATRLLRGARKPQKGAKFVYPKRKSYLTFLGGDYPQMTARTSVKNGRRVMLIKNSYGNPMGPFLLHSFETVIIIDYRSFKGQLSAVIEEEKITDLIVQNASLTSVSSFHHRKIKGLFKHMKAKAPTAK